MKIKSDDKEVYIVSPLTVVLIVIAVAMLAAVIALYFVGKKAQKRQEEQNEQLAATAQTVSMLIITVSKNASSFQTAYRKGKNWSKSYDIDL